MASLKLIADEISDALARPFDDMFKERIKSIFRHELATIIKQQIEKYGIHNQFKSNFQTTCIESSNVVTSLYEADVADNWYRTENKVPTPVRYMSDDPFTFVGNILDNIPYIYTNFTENLYVSHLPMMQKEYQKAIGQTSLNKPSRYFYRDGYIYVYSENIDTSEPFILNIEGVFVGNPNSVVDGSSITDDIEFPMPEDLIQTVKERLLKGELSIIDNKDKIPQANIDNN